VGQNKGILYVATGDTHRSEAVRSARRVSNLDKSYNISLVTDENPPEDSYFENIILLSDPMYGFGDKPKGIKETPYDRTLYLDSDTYVISSDGIKDLFDTLDYCDLCGVLDSARSLETLPENFTLPNQLEEIPNTFTWINTGVLVMETTETTGLLTDWVNYHKKLTQLNKHSDPFNRGLTDQAAFRWALFTNDISYHIAPPEYNFRLPYPTSVHDPVHILHGNNNDMQKIAHKVNKNQQTYRQFLPRRWTPEDDISESDSYHLCTHLLARVLGPLLRNIQSIRR
jgi:hypothetical protein